MGKVRVDPVGLFLIDRRRRYQETGLFSSVRYHSAWFSTQTNAADWPDTYIREKNLTTQKFERCESIEVFRDEFRNSMNGNIRTAIELIGDPASTRNYPVRTPQIAGVKDPEKETYRWFTENKKQGIRGQFLRPIAGNSQQLLALDDTWGGSEQKYVPGHK